MDAYPHPLGVVAPFLSRPRPPEFALQNANVRSIMAVHLWLRAEKKPNERRTHITPERCKDLVKAGEDARLFFFLFLGGGDGEVEWFLELKRAGKQTFLQSQGPGLG